MVKFGMQNCEQQLKEKTRLFWYSMYLYIVVQKDFCKITQVRFINRPYIDTEYYI